MIEFFKHKKFWLPLTLIVAIIFIIEIALRLGFYDQLVKPKSRLGASFGRISDLQKMDSKSIHWVTIGDSKFDWGLDHKKIRLSQLKKGINHIRMSLAGSNFMSIHSSIEWSIDHLPQLDGMMIGMYESEFITLSHPAKEFKTSWPFRAYLNHDEFNYFRQFKNYTSLRIWFNSLAITNYSSDIKDLLRNPWSRVKELTKRDQRWMNHIDFKHDVVGDLCDFDLENLNQCIATAKQFKTLKEVPLVFQSAYKNCTRESTLIRQKNKQWKTHPINLAPFKKQWEYLFDKILESNKKISLVLLPENEYYSYMSKPSNAGELVEQLVAQYQNNPKFQVLDLRNLFDETKQCQYYFDNLHFNNLGIEILTDRVVNALNEYIDQNHSQILAL